MAMRLGSGSLVFEPVENWEKLPEGWSFIDVAGVAVDARDHVYVFNRGDHPVVVFDRDGKFLRSFGEGLFSKRPHGIHTVPTIPSIAWMTAFTRSRNSPSTASGS